MPVPELAPNEKYTYRDYVTWPDDERWEIIDGVAYNMTPAPSWSHQSISMKLSKILANALEGKPCVPMAAPCDVILSDENVVQPDLFVVCDRSKISEKGLMGAPDLVIEILSPSSLPKDQLVKKDLYEKFGVREYCLFDPAWKCVYRYALGEDGKYAEYEYFEAQMELTLTSVPDVTIRLTEIFEEKTAG